MNILVLSGSPKGENSITLQHARYLEALHGEHRFTYLHIGTDYRKYERDFAPAAQALKDAELVLFVYPVFTFLTPYPLHRFIECMKASGADLRGKFCAQITTSKHFYDVTAHRFILENCQDMGMKYISGLSADMEDLLHEKGRKEARDFFDFLLFSVENDRFVPLPAPSLAPRHKPVTVPDATGGKLGDVVIVADLEPGDTQLYSMIARLRAVLPRKTRLVNLREFPFRGGCLSCFRCASNGHCVYTDGFEDFLRHNIQSAEAIVLAFSIRDHSMGSLFKLYDDRQFCNGHRSVTMGKPFGYLVSGDLARESNLKMLIEARASVGGSFLAGTADDEADPDTQIDRLAHTLAYAIEKKYTQPADFYGVGGMKIFRDLIWGMQGLMREDHRFYKAHKLYDFPQKQWPRMLAMYLVGSMAASPRMQKKLGSSMTAGMIVPFQKIIENAKRGQ